jgi:hypothetical protein
LPSDTEERVSDFADLVRGGYRKRCQRRRTARVTGADRAAADDARRAWNATSTMERNSS